MVLLAGESKNSLNAVRSFGMVWLNGWLVWLFSAGWELISRWIYVIFVGKGIPVETEYLSYS